MDNEINSKIYKTKTFEVNRFSILNITTLIILLKYSIHMFSSKKNPLYQNSILEIFQIWKFLAHPPLSYFIHFGESFENWGSIEEKNQ